MRTSYTTSLTEAAIWTNVRKEGPRSALLVSEAFTWKSKSLVLFQTVGMCFVDFESECAKCLFFCWNVNANSFVNFVCVFFLVEKCLQKCKRQGSGELYFLRNNIWSVYILALNIDIIQNVCWVIISHVDNNFLLWGLSGICIGCVFLCPKICDLFIRKDEH